MQVNLGLLDDERAAFHRPQPLDEHGQRLADAEPDVGEVGEASRLGIPHHQRVVLAGGVHRRDGLDLDARDPLQPGVHGRQQRIAVASLLDRALDQGVHDLASRGVGARRRRPPELVETLRRSPEGADDADPGEQRFQSLKGSLRALADGLACGARAPSLRRLCAYQRKEGAHGEGEVGCFLPSSVRVANPELVGTTGALTAMDSEGPTFRLHLQGREPGRQGILVREGEGDVGLRVFEREGQRERHVPRGPMEMDDVLERARRIEGAREVQTRLVGRSRERLAQKEQGLQHR